MVIMGTEESQRIGEVVTVMQRSGGKTLGVAQGRIVREATIEEWVTYCAEVGLVLEPADLRYARECWFYAVLVD